MSALGAAAAAGTSVTGCGSGSSSRASASSPRTSPSSPQGSTVPASPSMSPTPASHRPLYIGTYTSAEGGGKGIGLASYDPVSGRITGVGTLTGVPDPSYLALHPDGRTLHPAQLVVSPDGRHAFLANRGDDTLARYAVEEDGARLELLGTVPVAGDFPRQIALAPDGRLLFAANQRSGTVSVFHVQGGELRLAGEPFASPVAVCALPL